MNCRVCISLERKVCHLEGSLGSINVVQNLSPTDQTLGAKTHKRCCHIGVLVGIVLWQLASSVMAQKTNVLLLTNQIARIFCLLN
jgi:hypothetical protein